MNDGRPENIMPLSPSQLQMRISITPNREGRYGRERSCPVSTGTGLFKKYLPSPPGVGAFVPDLSPHVHYPVHHHSLTPTSLSGVKALGGQNHPARGVTPHRGMQRCANSPLLSTMSVRPDISMPKQRLGTLAPASGSNGGGN